MAVLEQSCSSYAAEQDQTSLVFTSIHRHLNNTGDVTMNSPSTGRSSWTRGFSAGVANSVSPHPPVHVVRSEMVSEEGTLFATPAQFSHVKERPSTC